MELDERLCSILETVRIGIVKELSISDKFSCFHALL